MTLAFWLGRGTLTCAKAETAKHNRNSTAKNETEIRFRELMIFLLKMGLAHDTTERQIVKCEIANCEFQSNSGNGTLSAISFGNLAIRISQFAISISEAHVECLPASLPYSWSSYVS